MRIPRYFGIPGKFIHFDLRALHHGLGRGKRRGTRQKLRYPRGLDFELREGDRLPVEADEGEAGSVCGGEHVAIEGGYLVGVGGNNFGGKERVAVSRGRTGNGEEEMRGVDGGGSEGKRTRGGGECLCHVLQFHFSLLVA